MKNGLDFLTRNLVALRSKYFSDRNFLIISAIIVGIAAGLASVLLKLTVHFIQKQLVIVLQHKDYSFLFYFFPLAGILLTVLFVQKIRKGKLGRGIGNIMYSISRRSGNIPADNTYTHLITSAVTVGFGGSVGLEAPIVVTGSALGSNIARIFLLSHKERIILIACGAAAGISAVFNTPVAGVLFAMEVLLSEFSIPTFIPVLIAAASAAVISTLLYKEHLFFLITRGWRMDAIPFYLMLGVLCGLVSVYFMRMYSLSEKRFAASKSVYRKAIAGGLLLGLFIFILPPLYGEGYVNIEQLFQGQYNDLYQHSFFHSLADRKYTLLFFALGLVLLKIFATAVTIGAGGNGGIFAPTLFTGAITGFGFAHFFNTTQLKELVTVNFIAAGMAGILSGVVHAPLTAIFLIAEVTGGYTLFVPLMIVSAISYFITRAIEPYSIYTGKLAEKGIILDDKQAVLLRNINLADIIETDQSILKKDQPLRAVVEAFSQSNRNIFPVLNNRNEIEGIIYIDDIKSYLFKPEVYDKIKVRELMTKPGYKIFAGDEMTTVMKKFDHADAWYLPVNDEQQKFIGFADKRKLLNLLREGLTAHQLKID